LVVEAGDYCAAGEINCVQARDFIFTESPTAMIRSPRMANASTHGRALLLVNIVPLNRIKSGVGFWPRANPQK